MIVIFFVFILSTVCSAEQMTVTHAHTQKVGMRIAYLGCTAERVAQVVAADMACSGHYAVDVQEYSVVPSKKKDTDPVVEKVFYFCLYLNRMLKQ